MNRRSWAWMVAATFGVLIGMANIDSVSDYLMWILLGIIFYGIYECILGDDGI